MLPCFSLSILQDHYAALKINFKTYLNRGHTFKAFFVGSLESQGPVWFNLIIIFVIRITMFNEWLHQCANWQSHFAAIKFFQSTKSGDAISCFTANTHAHTSDGCTQCACIIWGKKCDKQTNKVILWIRDGWILHKPFSFLLLCLRGSKHFYPIKKKYWQYHFTVGLFDSAKIHLRPEDFRYYLIFGIKLKLQCGLYLQSERTEGQDPKTYSDGRVRWGDL